jgi:hypothetical protein
MASVHCGKPEREAWFARRFGSNELVVQSEIAANLKVRLPCPTLVRQNQVLIRDAIGACLPDVIVDRIGGGCWAAIELKLLLAGDRLTDELLEHDIDKLCRYKSFYPHAHCIFLLVGSGSRDSASESNDGAFAIGQGESPFKTVGEMIERALIKKKLFKSHVCAVSQFRTATRAAAWEIIHAAGPESRGSHRYRFTAKMQD